jgi:signal transduction histidine kinase
MQLSGVPKSKVSLQPGTPILAGLHPNRGHIKANEPNALVFVVDDDPGMRRSIENLVRSAGLQVRVFASAEAFLKTIERGSLLRPGRPDSRRQASRPVQRTLKSKQESSESTSEPGLVRCTDMPACLVLDVQLRGISGLDLQRRMAESRIEIPIIFITGHGDIRTSVCAMKAGAVEFLTKPFSHQDLIDAIQNAIERNRTAGREISSKTEGTVFYPTHHQLNRLAGEIHDGLAQNLSAIHIQLSAAKEVLSSQGNGSLCNLDQMIGLAKQSLVETRRCVHNLSASECQESGLKAELQQLAERWDIAGRWRCRFQSDRIPESKISSITKGQLLRIAQEAVNNAARHAAPTLILLTLKWQPPDVVLRVIDNGNGFAAELRKRCEGFGLRNMRARAEEIGARFDVLTAVGRGTSIVVSVPVS